MSFLQSLRKARLHFFVIKIKIAVTGNKTVLAALTGVKVACWEYKSGRVEQEIGFIRTEAYFIPANAAHLLCSFFASTYMYKDSKCRHVPTLISKQRLTEFLSGKLGQTVLA